MQLPPLDVIATWPLPNYINPVTRGPASTAVILVLYPLVCLVIFLRIYARLVISKSFGPDDWLILASLVPTTAYTITSLLAALHFGWNRHVWDMRLDRISISLKLVITTEILFTIAASLTKCSMLMLTHRVVGVGTSSRRVAKATVATIIFIILYSTAFVFTVVFQCKPISAYWTLSLQPQKCISQSALLLGAGIINTFTDLLVVILPIPVVWRLQLPTRQRVAVVILFGIGFLVTITGGVRTMYTYKVTKTYDQTWMALPVWVSSSIELYVGIICASVPATKKFFCHFIPKLFGSLSSEAANAENSNSSDLTDLAPKDDLEYGFGRIRRSDVYNLSHEDRKRTETAYSHDDDITKTRSFETDTTSFKDSDKIQIGPARSSGSSGTDGTYDVARHSLFPPN